MLRPNHAARRLTPIAAAVTVALLGIGASAPTLAADVEIKAPAGGSVVIRNADGTVLVLSADSAGNVRVPGLPASATATAGVVCFDASGQLAKCPPNYGATGPTGATGLQGVAGVTGPSDPPPSFTDVDASAALLGAASVPPHATTAAVPRAPTKNTVEICVFIVGAA